MEQPPCLFGYMEALVQVLQCILLWQTVQSPTPALHPTGLAAVAPAGRVPRGFVVELSMQGIQGEVPQGELHWKLGLIRRRPAPAPGGSATGRRPATWWRRGVHCRQCARVQGPAQTHW